MVILNIVGSKIWGGGEQYVYDISQEYTHQSIATYTLVDVSNDAFVKKYSEVSTVFTAHLYRCKGLGDIFSVAKRMREAKVDVIHCHSGKYILLAIALKKLTGAKLIFFKHNVVKGKTDGYHRWIAKKVDAFICVSQLVYDLQVTPMYSDKYHLVYNGVNPSRLHIEGSVQKNDVPFTVGYAGRIHRNKGLQELIDAIEWLVRNENQLIRLLIHGNGSAEEMHWLRDYLAEKGLGSVISYEGFTHNIEEAFQQYDVLVLPSKVQEAFGLVICEAMYAKVPVVTSTSGAQGEIIIHGENGWLLEQVTSDCIANTLKVLMSDSALRRSMVEAGFHTVTERFMIEHTVHQLVQIELNLLEEG